MRTLAWLPFLIFFGCGSSDNNGSPDLSASPPDFATLLSQCGHPGDPGNSKGVGKFCTPSDSDCMQPAALCSAIGNGSTPSSSDTYFCTEFCTVGKTDCGENAGCFCDPGGRGCVCTPFSCTGGPPVDMATGTPDGAGTD